MSEEDNAPELGADKPQVEYEPLPDFAPEPKEKTFSAEREGLESAAHEVTKARQSREVPTVAEDAPITERDYKWQQGHGENVEPHFTVDARRASVDLAQVREAEHLAAQPDTAAAVDEVRNAWNNPQQQQPQPDPQTQQQPQQVVEQPQQQQVSQEDQLRKILTEHPEVRKAMEVELQQVEVARQAYQTGTWQAAQVSAASLLANYPELAQVPTEHLKTAIAAVAATNPERAMQINAHLERTQALYNASKQAEAQQQQLQMQNMQAWVAAEDARFERDVVSKEDPRNVPKNKRKHRSNR